MGEEIKGQKGERGDGKMAGGGKRLEDGKSKLLKDGLDFSFYCSIYSISSFFFF
jgi:hypothetical protein